MKTVKIYKESLSSSQPLEVGEVDILLVKDLFFKRGNFILFVGSFDQTPIPCYNLPYSFLDDLKNFYISAIKITLDREVVIKIKGD